MFIPLRISDLMEVFQAHSQYKACFFLKMLLLETQEIKLNLALGFLTEIWW